MAEKHYAFLKTNRVEDTLVFLNQDEELAQKIVDENGYDSFIWLDSADVPHRWSTYDEKTKTFTEATDEYLISIRVIDPEIIRPVDPTPAS
jgi:hypothetical protein